MSKKARAAIGSLGTYINGRGFKPEDWGRVGLPIVRIANLNNPKAAYDFYDGPIDDGHKIDTGDTVVSWSATLDAFRWNRGPAALNQHSFKVVPNLSVIDPDYLYFVLKVAMKGMSELVHGATMKHVTRPEFEGFEIEIETERYLQKKIATGLKAQLAEVETALQAAQVQLKDSRLLRSRMLKAFFAELDAAPKKKLGDYAETTSGVTPSRDNDAYWQPAEIPWVKTGEVDFSPITAVKESISKKALLECSLSLLPPKSILIAITGEGKTRGRSAILEVPATTNQHCFAILPNDTWESSFLQLWLRASYQYLRELSSGRGGSRSALSGAQLKALDVPAPSKAEQQQIVVRIQAAMTEIDALENSSKAALEDINRLPNRVLAQAFDQ